MKFGNKIDVLEAMVGPIPIARRAGFHILYIQTRYGKYFFAHPTDRWAQLRTASHMLRSRLNCFSRNIENRTVVFGSAPALGARAEGAKDRPVRFVGPPVWPVLSAKHQGPIDSTGVG